MRETPPLDVVVVGGGPVGVTLSNLLAQHGLRVTALERETDVYHMPRARHVDWEGMRIFQTFGAADRLEQDMLATRGLRVLDASGELLLEYTAPPLHPAGWADYQMSQPNLEETLRGALASTATGELRTAHEVTALEDRSDHVVVHVRDLVRGTTAALRTRFVVGCDGANSMVRDHIGSRYQPLGPDHPFLVVDAAGGNGQLPDRPTIVCDPTRPHYVSPGGRFPSRFEFMVMPDDDPDELTSTESVIGLLRDVIPTGQFEIVRAALYRFHSLAVDRWRSGRVMIAGDAAHVQPPFMGQGLMSGLRDAANLAWKLALVCQGESDESLLDTYEAERKAHARAWIEEANRIGGIVMTTDADEARARDLRLAENSAELRPIEPQLGPGLHSDDPPPAGTLAPQPRLADGRRMDDVVGPRFLLAARASLLRAATTDLPGSEHIVVLDDDDPGIGQLLDGLRASAVIIRPDRYVLGLAHSPEGLSRLVDRVPVRTPGRRCA
ncbi:bifunctional 3-(3-hydroxy-phenyl)propionate/3-hydroxycinnamic acid hydroxylase [Egicoccus sp. AB-alg2]|uniref:bifunctional 3-(3-hydroxy-phenyl)propionate/3-hydroxycinnamic acid hydroxylase n=1 Tax=Egicoccus sp. AB-alg2 TaxID=3242693 RepID=UPI00359E8812